MTGWRAGGGLYGLSTSWKLLITAFLLVLGAGYLSGALNAALAVGLTPAAVGGHYRDQTLSPAEAEVVAEHGFVEEEFSLDDVEPEGEAADHPAMPAGHEAEGGKSITSQQLAQLAHVHLLGFAMILLSMGVLACLTALSEGVKATIVVVLGVSMVTDIGGLWLVRFVSDAFAWLPVAGGVGIGAGVGLTALRVLWELWGPRPAAQG